MSGSDKVQAAPGGKGGGKGGGGGGGKGGGNNTAPTDIQISSASVDENTAAGTQVGTFSATDPDRKERFTFTLEDDAGGTFAITGNNKLVIADGAVIDYETTPSYTIIVKVTDKAGNTYTESMTISVNDVFEPANTAPTSISLSSTDVDENSAGGTVIGTLGNNDPDPGDSWTYQITSDPDSKFDIVGNQLVVRSGAVLDYETDTQHSVWVQVTDAAGASHTQSFVISVNDIFEPANTAPTAITLSNANIDENSAGGTVIGTLGNDDPDPGDSWTYQIVGDPDAKFDIVGNQLVVRSGAVLDYETDTQHSVSVRVTDAAGASYTQSFVISVNDVFEPVNPGPTDMSLSGNQVSEGASNGSLVGVLTTTDPDAGETFAYVLLDSAGGRFTLEGDQLKIANTSMIDYEAATSHNVTVRVTDSTGNTYDETFTVGVQDQSGLAEQPDYVQALIPGSNGQATRFWPNTDPSTPTQISYAILTDFPSYVDASNLPFTDYTNASVPFTQLTGAQLTVINQLLAELEELLNVEFVQVATAEQAQITFGQYTMDANVGAYAYYASGSGSTGTLSGDIWLNSRYDTSPSTSETSGADWARSTIAHELGHAMGLKHPGDYNAGGGGTQGPYLDPAVDNGQYTTMSYNDFPYSSLDPIDFQLYDVAALQSLYGANDGYATGNNVYAFGTTPTLIDTVWDAGGYDTFSGAGASTGVTINLNQGAFSSFGVTNAIAIAYGTDIEAAVGSSHADTLIGNVLDNSFTGGGGADTFVFDDDWGFDVIVDFQNGLDLIDLSLTAFTWGDLSIGNGAGGAEIAAGSSLLTLSGIDASLVDMTDFVFV